MTDARHWSSSRFRRWQVAAIAATVSPLVAGLSRTWSWRVEGGEHLAALAAAGEPVILAFWHGRILPGLAFFRDRGIVVLTSENFDGEWIARVIRRFGFATVRGSTSRGGARALVQLRRALATGRSVALTLDGPRGPRHVAQAGAPWLARATGCPIVPFHVEATRRWTLPSWDRGQIPQPFATLHVCIGAPRRIAPGDALPDALSLLQQDLRDLMVRSAALAAVPGEVPGADGGGPGRAR